MLRRIVPFAILTMLLASCTLPIPVADTPTETATQAPPPTITPAPPSETPTDDPTATPSEIPASETPTATEVIETATATGEGGIAETPTASATIPPEGATATPTPTADPNTGGGEPPLGDGTAETNDVIFVRGGQVFAIGLNGQNERQLFAQDEDSGAVINLALSPDGETLAFILANSDLVLLDLTSGDALTISEQIAVTSPPLLWAPDSNKVYFQRILQGNSGLPDILQFWETTRSGQVALITEAEIAPPDSLSPVRALGNDQLAVLLGTISDGELFILDTFNGTLVPVGEDLGLWDVFADGTIALVYDRQALDSGSEPLILGDFGLSVGVTNATIIEATDDGNAYRNAKFAPTEFLIAALQQSSATNSELVLLSPENDGSFTTTALDTDPNLQDLSFAWTADEDAVVVQRLPQGGSAFSLWVVPIDGSDATQLVEGEQPQVVGGR